MSNIRKSNAVNLVVGLVLVLIGIRALMSIIGPNAPSASLAGEGIFVLLFIFVGGYETGKYAEGWYAKSRAKAP
jgi:hypothetical protein